MRHYLSAWTLAQGLPARDLRRIEALEGLADLSEDAAQRKAYLQQIITELDQPVGAERLHVATAREHMAWDEPQPRNVCSPAGGGAETAQGRPGHRRRLATRLQLARALDDYGDTAAAQTQLLARVEDLPWPQPQDRSRAALQQRIQRLLAQVDLTWFLLAHEHFQEARRSADYTEHLLPPDHHRKLGGSTATGTGAALWVHLLAAQSTGLAAQWKRMTQPGTMALAATKRCWCMRRIAPWWQQLGDAALLAQAREGVTQSRAQLPPSGSALCRTVDAATAGWRAPSACTRKRIPHRDRCVRGHPSQIGVQHQQTGGLLGGDVAFVRRHHPHLHRAAMRMNGHGLRKPVAAWLRAGSMATSSRPAHGKHRRARLHRVQCRR